MVFEDKNFF